MPTIFPDDKYPHPHRVDVINALIQKFGYTSYLEVGTKDCGTFDRIVCAAKEGCDINPFGGGRSKLPAGIHNLASDDYFARRATPDKFDIVFVDGAHERDQVHRDVLNALRCLRPGGSIVMHDCNPLQEIHQRVPRASGAWNGDVWKAFLFLRRRPDLDAAVGAFDSGVGVVRVRPNSAPLDPASLPSDPTWSDLETHRQEWLRLMDFDELLSFAGL